MDETQIDDHESMDVTEPDKANAEGDPFGSDLDDDMFADTEMSASQTSEPPRSEDKKTEDFPKFDRFDSTGNEQGINFITITFLQGDFNSQ